MRINATNVWKFYHRSILLLSYLNVEINHYELNCCYHLRLCDHDVLRSAETDVQNDKFTIQSQILKRPVPGGLNQKSYWFR